MTIATPGSSHGVTSSKLQPPAPYPSNIILSTLTPIGIIHNRHPRPPAPPRDHHPTFAVSIASEIMCAGIDIVLSVIAQSHRQSVIDEVTTCMVLVTVRTSLTYAMTKTKRNCTRT